MPIDNQKRIEIPAKPRPKPFKIEICDSLVYPEDINGTCGLQCIGHILEKSYPELDNSYEQITALIERYKTLWYAPADYTDEQKEDWVKSPGSGYITGLMVKKILEFITDEKWFDFGIEGSRHGDMRVKELVTEFNDITMAIKTFKHMTAVINGTIFDTTDPSLDIIQYFLVSEKQAKVFFDINKEQTDDLRRKTRH